MKTSAEAAEAAARSAKHAIGRFSAIEACGAAAQQLQELKGLLRRNETATLPDKCSAVRSRLVQIRLEVSDPKAQTFLSGAIEFYNELERDHDNALRRGEALRNNFPKDNATINQQELYLIELAAMLRKQA